LVIGLVVYISFFCHWLFVKIETLLFLFRIKGYNRFKLIGIFMLFVEDEVNN
jgi:hypothetical protein